MELIQKPRNEEQEKEIKSTKKKNRRYEIWENIKTLVITITITLLFMHFIAQLGVVRGESMANTFHDSNIVLMEKLTQRFSELSRFDVVIFNTGNPQKPHYIKRIVGLPGETIQITEDGTIYIDGNKLDEYYGREIIEDPGIAINPITLGEDEYFVMGDNRNNSIDSRFSEIGPIKKDVILGHVIYGLSPFKNPSIEQRRGK